MPASKFHHFSVRGFSYPLKSASVAVESLKEGGYIWLNLYNPSRDELNDLTELLGVHPLSVEDCMDTSQVPKIEHFQGNSFFIFNAYAYAEKTLHMDEVDFFLGRDFLITVSGINSDGRDPLAGVGSYIEKGQELLKSGPAFLMHLVLDYIVDQKFEAFEKIEDELEEYEELVLDDPRRFRPGDLMRLRKDLAGLRKSLFHERETLIKICRKDCPYILDPEIIHFRDVYDHLAKFFELTESHRETVTSLMELYTSLLNNLMTKMSNQTSVSVRRLTIISTVFMPLTLLASIGGMSEWSMMTGSENWKTSYPLFLLGMILIGVLNFYLIRRLDRKQRGDALPD